MRYRITILLLAFILMILGGCKNSTNPVIKDKTNNASLSNNREHDSEDIGTGGFQLFHLGMTTEEVKVILQENNLEIINEIENTGDPQEWDWGNKSIWTEGLSFSFDPNNILYELSVYDEESVLHGIKIGDEEAKLQEAYGQKYKLYESEELLEMGMTYSSEKDQIAYEITVNDHYYFAFVSKHKITNWGISKYKLGTNSPVTESYDQLPSKMTNRELKSKLFQEFEQYVKEIQSGNDIKFNQVMVSDRGRGLLILDEAGVIKLSDHELREVQSTLDEVKDSLKDSNIFTGYSNHGIRFTAILSPVSLENEGFNDAINQLSGDPHESKFLVDIIEESDERVLQVGLDLRAEILLPSKKSEIKLEKINISNPDEENATEAYSDHAITELLKKYNRASIENNLMVDGSWYTFIYDGTLIYNPKITIYLENEVVTLENS